MRGCRWLTGVTTALALIWSCSALAEPNRRTLQILHFGNLDGAFAPLSCSKADSGRVSFANLLSKLEELRPEGDTLVLSSGNVIGDAPFFDFLLRQGESGIVSFAQIVNASGVALMTPGVAEFSVPYRMFLEFLGDLDKAGVPYRAANVKPEGDAGQEVGPLVNDPVHLQRFGSLTVAVIPLVGGGIAGVVHPKNVAGLAIDDPVATASRLAGEARKLGADVVIALVNLENVEGATGATIDFVRQVAGVDLVVAGGMTSPGQTEPVIRSARIGPNQVRLVGTPRAPAALGVATLRMERRNKRWRIAGFQAALSPVSTFRRDAVVASLLEQATTEFCSIGQRIIGAGRVDPPMDADAFLNHVLEVVRRDLRTDLAILSEDSLRRGEETTLAGPVTAGFLARVFSRHEVVVLSVLGQDLKNYVAHYYSAGGESLRKELFLAGARLLKDGTVEVNDRPIHLKRRYTIATSDFLASGGKGLISALARATETRRKQTRFFLRELVLRHFAQPEVGPVIGAGGFPSLWDRPLWEFNLTANGAVTNVSIDNPGDYAETQLTSRSPNTGVKGDGQFLAVMSTRDHKVSEFLKAQYGMVQIGEGGFDETQDLVTQELQYSWTGWRNRDGKGRFWIPAPLARGKLETEFSPAPAVYQEDEDGNILTDTSGENLLAYDPYHHLEVTGVVGLEFLFGSQASASLGYGMRSELLATPGSNLEGWHNGIEFSYQINKLPLYSWGTVSGLTLDSRFDLFFSDMASEQTLKSSGSTKLVASVLGPLSFTLGFDFFLYRTGDLGLAYAFDTMVGLSFSYDAAVQQF